jgi:hypothetical protein
MYRSGRVRPSGEKAPHRVLDDVALLVEGAKEVLRDPVVIRRRRAGEQVVRYAEIAQVLADQPAVVISRLSW